jgi:hypothetical protein
MELETVRLVRLRAFPGRRRRIPWEEELEPVAIDGDLYEVDTFIRRPSREQRREIIETFRKAATAGSTHPFTKTVDIEAGLVALGLLDGA